MSRSFNNIKVITGTFPFFIAKNTVKKTAIILPQKAINGIANMLNEEIPKAIDNTAPVAAPAEIPIIPGSAKGLLKSPCITAPDTPNAAPTKSPTIILGSLIYQITAISSLVKSLISKKGLPNWYPTTAKALLTGIFICPNVKDIQAMIHSANNNKNKIAFLLIITPPKTPLDKCYKLKLQ